MKILIGVLLLLGFMLLAYLMGKAEAQRQIELDKEREKREESLRIIKEYIESQKEKEDK